MAGDPRQLRALRRGEAEGVIDQKASVQRGRERREAASPALSTGFARARPIRNLKGAR
ncbi:hypothetical protein GGD65_004838 [Bradyrhizobium sp. CIR18]|nr:hypothetical protein [Bradyrhizobium sp. CIR18]